MKECWFGEGEKEKGGEEEAAVERREKGDGGGWSCYSCNFSIRFIVSSTL